MPVNGEVYEARREAVYATIRDHPGQHLPSIVEQVKTHPAFTGKTTGRYTDIAQYLMELYMADRVHYRDGWHITEAHE